MKLPPALSKVRLAKGGEKGLHIWLPVFLVWPLLLVVGGVLLALALVVDGVLMLMGSAYHHYSRLILGVFGAVGEARGMSVAIYGPQRAIHIELR